MNTAIARARPRRPAASIGARLSSMLVILPAAALSRTGRAALAQRQRQRPIVTGQFQVALARGTRGLQRADRAFPIEGTARETCIVLLIVQQRFDRKLAHAQAHQPAHRIGDAGARRTPAPHRSEGNIVGTEVVYLSAGVAQRATGPIRLSLVAADPECHDRAAVVEIQSDPIPSIRRAIKVLARTLVIAPPLAADA